MATWFENQKGNKYVKKKVEKVEVVEVPTPSDVEKAREKVHEAQEQIAEAERILEREHTHHHIIEESPSFFQRVGQLFTKAKDTAHEVTEVPGHVKQAVEQGMEGMKERVSGTVEKGREMKDDVKDKLVETFEKGKEKVHGGVESVVQKKDDIKEWVKSHLEQGKEKVEELSEAAQEKAKHLKEKMEGLGQQATHSAQNAAQNAKDKMMGLGQSAQESVNNMKEMAKESAENVKEKVMGTGYSVKESAEQMAQHAKYSANQASQQAKEGAQSTMGAIKEKIGGLFHTGGEQPTQQQQVQQQLESAVETIEKAKQDLVIKMKSIEATTSGGILDMLKGKKEEGKEGTVESKVVEEIRETLDQTKKDMNQRLQQLNTLLSQCKHPQQPSTYQSFHDSISKSMNEMSNLVNSLTSQLQHKITSPFQRWTQPKNKYLLQSCNYQPGLTITYTNDNGDEVLDVTGEKADESLDKLKTLNEFRSEFNLPPAESVGNVSVFIHQLKQPRVLVKGTKVIDDIQYKYQYDNGLESLNVTLNDSDSRSPLRAVDDMKALDIFRLAFGISPKQGPQHLSTTYHHVLTSKKGKDEL